MEGRLVPDSAMLDPVEMSQLDQAPDRTSIPARRVAVRRFGVERRSFGCVSSPQTGRMFDLALQSERHRVKPSCDHIRDCPMGRPPPNAVTSIQPRSSAVGSVRTSTGVAAQAESTKALESTRLDHPSSAPPSTRSMQIPRLVPASAIGTYTSTSPASTSVNTVAAFPPSKICGSASYVTCSAIAASSPTGTASS